MAKINWKSGSYFQTGMFYARIYNKIIVPSVTTLATNADEDNLLPSDATA